MVKATVAVVAAARARAMAVAEAVVAAVMEAVVAAVMRVVVARSLIAVGRRQTLGCGASFAGAAWRRRVNGGCKEAVGGRSEERRKDGCVGLCLAAVHHMPRRGSRPVLSRRRQCRPQGHECSRRSVSCTLQSFLW